MLSRALLLLSIMGLPAVATAASPAPAQPARQPLDKLDAAIRARGAGGAKVFVKVNVGGGIYGALSVRMERAVEKRVAAKRGIQDFHIADHLAGAAGTSIGSIIVLAQASGKTNEELLEQFPKLGKHIFGKQSLGRRLAAALGLRPKYKNTGLVDALTETLGERTLGELNYPVLVPTYAIKTPARHEQGSGGMLIDSMTTGADGKVRHADVKARELAAASSSAQTYFDQLTPGKEPGEALAGYAFQDGGIFANNPSAHVTTTIVERARQLGVDLNPAKDIAVLTFGTGRDAPKPPPKQGVVARWMGKSRGAIDLLVHGPTILDEATGGHADASHFMMKRLMGKNYQRVDPPIDHEVDLGMSKKRAGLDNPELVQPLYDFVDKNASLAAQIDETADWVIEQLRLQPAEAKAQ